MHGSDRRVKRMKILMPVLMKQNVSFTLDEGRIIGGMERFQALVFENFSDIIVPIYVSWDDRRWVRLKPILERAAADHSATAIFWNEAKGYAVKSAELGLQLILLDHQGECRGTPGMARAPSLNAMADVGARIFFVSEHQHRNSNAFSCRFTKRPLDYVQGYIPSAFASGDEEVSKEVIFDCGTIGRIDKSKDPFWVHKQLRKSSLTSCVITSDALNEKNQTEYGAKNEHWDAPRYTFRNLSYAENMKLLSQFGCYISTCRNESWGITALEALAHGVPLILRGDAAGTHASASHADIDADYDIYTKGMKPTDLENLIRQRLEMTYADRCDLAARTKAKHSKANWMSAVSGMLTGLS